MKSIDIFNNKCTYKDKCDVENDIKIIDMLSERVREPMILLQLPDDYYCLPESIDTTGLKDKHSICDALPQWIYDSKTNGGEDICECLLSMSAEDVEWAEKTKENFRGLTAHRITYSRELQNEIAGMLNEYKARLTEMLNWFVSEKGQQKC